MAFNQSGFAVEQMNKCGWSKGKGLGKSENGMTDAIKVKLKNNKGGLGHDHGAEFTFHWWDHIFNKAANSFKVSESNNGAVIEKCEQNKVTPYLISNKKPLSGKFANKSLMYGSFVKSGTYNSENGNKGLSDNLTDSDSSDESSDDESLPMKDTLQKTFDKTGLTGHKAARHGLHLNGKLQRIHEQEKKQLAVISVTKDDHHDNLNCDKQKKKKRKKKKVSENKLENEKVISGEVTSEKSVIHSSGKGICKMKERKLKSIKAEIVAGQKEEKNADEVDVKRNRKRCKANVEEMDTKKKHKKKKRKVDDRC